MDLILYNVSLSSMQCQITDVHGAAKVVDFFDLLKEFRYTILYFYPKDNTPGCTIEAVEFTRLLSAFDAQKTQIIGVSKDNHRSHCNFIEKQGLKITLLSDTDLILHKKFDALGEKSMYGKKYLGTLRNTYLLDSNGEVLYSRRTVSAPGHAKQVLDYIEAL